MQEEDVEEYGGDAVEGFMADAIDGDDMLMMAENVMDNDEKTRVLNMCQTERIKDDERRYNAVKNAAKEDLSFEGNQDGGFG